MSLDTGMLKAVRRTRRGVVRGLAVAAAGWCVFGLSAGCDRTGSTTVGGKPKIGAILMQQDQFFRSCEAGMKAAAEQMGVDLRVQNATGALDKEVTLVETFVAQRVAAIVVSPLSTQASAPALKRAAAAGIKVVTYNNAVPGDAIACRIASDQEALGSSTGRAVRAFIEQQRGGKARVAILAYNSQLPEQSGARVRGFKQSLAGLAGVEFVAEQDAWLAPQAATTVAELLARQPEVIWAANEGGTVGAVTAVRNAGQSGRVVVFGTDVSAQLIDFLLAGDGILQAVTAQKPREMGQAAIESAVKLLRNEPIEANQRVPGILFSRDKPDELKAYRVQLTPG